ncbi:MAG: sugar phosphate isomerase/epimerase family protein [Dermatophilaceae bacterium]
MQRFTSGPLGLSALTVLDAPPPQTVSAAASAGFEYVGVRVFPAGDEPAWPMIGDTPMVRETRQRLADTGIQVWDVEVLRIRPDKDPHEATRILDAGAALGARYVLVNGNDPEEGRLLDRLNTVAAEAASRGITLAVEFMIFTDIKTLRQARALVDKVDGPAVVLADSLHFYRSAGTLTELTGIPSERMPYAQLCDARAEPPPASEAQALAEARTGRVLPGDGDLPLVDFVRALPDGTTLCAEAPVRDLPLEARCARAYASLVRTLPTD